MRRRGDGPEDTRRVTIRPSHPARAALAGGLALLAPALVARTDVIDTYWDDEKNFRDRIDHNGAVGLGDILAVLGGWGPCP